MQSKKILPFLLLTLAIASGSLWGQTTLETCNDDQCGPVLVSYSPSGGSNIFCENASITLENNSDTEDFDLFYIDWGDGQIDTIINTNFENADVSHNYSFPDLDRCADGPIFDQEIKFVGIQNCNGVQSCHTGTSILSVRVRPVAEFDLPAQICVTDAISPSNTSCNGIDYFWDFGNGDTSTDENPNYTFPMPGNYTVRLRVSNQCGFDEVTRSVSVVGEPLADFMVPTGTICAPTTITLTEITNSFSSTSWSITPADTLRWCLTDTSQRLTDPEIDVRFKLPGTYTIRLQATNTCGTDTEEITIEVGQGAMGSIGDLGPFCDQAVLTPADLLTQAISDDATSVSWTFTNASQTTNNNEDFGTVTFNQSGTVTLMVENECGATTSVANITVTPNEMPTIMDAPTQLCSGSGIITLTADPPDGTWTGNGIIPGTSNFDPSLVTAGTTTTITYTTGEGNCTNSDQVMIEISPSVPPSISGQTLLCEDGDPVIFTANPNTGMWDGDHIDPTTGSYDPAIAGPGTDTITYTYTDGNGCVNTATEAVVTEALPTVMVTPGQSLCVSNTITDLNALFNPVLSPSGGTISWDGPGVVNPNTGTFNPVTGNGGPLAAGTVTLSYTYQRNACTVSDTVDLELTEPQELSIGPIDTVVCVDAGTIQLYTNLQGGDWSGTGVNPTTGIVDLSALSAGGTFMYSYIFEAGTSCERLGMLSLEAINLANGLVAGPNVSLCVGVTNHQLTGQSPADGSWEGENVDPLTGAIDGIENFTPDSVYLYRYCLESDQVANCEACRTRELIVHSNPRAAFSVVGTTCINEDFQLGLDEPQGGLNYFWDFGDMNGSTAITPTHAYTTPGTYTIHLRVVNEFGCEDEFTREIFVSSPPTAAFSLGSTEGCAPFLLEVTNNSFGDDISSQWCIAGDTIDGTSPGEIILDGITQDTFFTILLKVTNSCGVRTFIDSVLVHPYPITRFGLDQDDGCSPLTVNAMSTTLGNPDMCSWDYGNGNTSTGCVEGETQVYTTPEDSVSRYLVTLIATNECGADTLEQEVTVFPPDVDAFISLDTAAGCAPYLFRPCSFSTEGSFLAWELLSPNNEVVNAGNETCPEFLLTEPGTYTLNLTASRCGSDIDTRTFEVLPAPVADFTAPLTACVGSTVNFTNLSENISGQQWDFGDLQSSNALDGSHTYDTAGVYLVTLTVFAEGTNCPATISQTIEITALPIADFALNDSIGCPPLRLDVTDLSFNATGYNWSFGVGDAGTNEQEPVFDYTTEGAYVLSLFVTDNNGCVSDTINETIIVHPTPIAAFSSLHERACLDYDTLQFLSNSTGNIITQDWQIEGAVYQGGQANHVPQTFGELDVFLVVSNDFGCRDSIQSTTLVLPSPRAEFTPDVLSGCEDLSVNFTNGSTFSDAYLWNYGNGLLANTENGQTVFQTAGSFAVELIATAENGCPADTSYQNIIVHPKPIAGFTYTAQMDCGTPTDIPFQSTATANTLLTWTFGDGAADTVQNPIHQYLAPGDYTVNQIVVNAFSCRDTFTSVVAIAGLPLANAELLPPEGCAPFTMQVNNLSEEALTYQWYLDDVLISEDTNPSIVFPTAGAYNLRMVANYGPRCADEFLFDPINVYPSPTADFLAFPNESPNIIGDVRFENTSLNASSYLWILGDGNTTTEVSPMHEYDINGPIAVSLVAFLENPGGLTCTDTLTQLINSDQICTFYANSVMTPDVGEADHRIFKPVGLGIEGYELAIYSRWGEQVWYTNEVDEKQPARTWDGIYRGQPVPQDVYIWRAIVDFEACGKVPFQGEIHVIR